MIYSPNPSYTIKLNSLSAVTVLFDIKIQKDAKYDCGFLSFVSCFLIKAWFLAIIHFELLQFCHTSGFNLQYGSQWLQEYSIVGNSKIPEWYTLFPNTFLKTHKSENKGSIMIKLSSKSMYELHRKHEIWAWF